MNNKWPDGTPKSLNNAFTLGYGDTPHGFTPGAPAAPAKLPVQIRLGGFGKNNGTIHGLGRRPGNFTISRKRTGTQG